MLILLLLLLKSTSSSSQCWWGLPSKSPLPLGRLSWGSRPIWSGTIPLPPEYHLPLLSNMSQVFDLVHFKSSLCLIHMLSDHTPSSWSFQGLENFANGGLPAPPLPHWTLVTIKWDVLLLKYLNDIFWWLWSDDNFQMFEWNYDFQIFQCNDIWIFEWNDEMPGGLCRSRLAGWSALAILTRSPQEWRDHP